MSFIDGSVKQNHFTCGLAKLWNYSFMDYVECKLRSPPLCFVFSNRNIIWEDFLERFYKINSSLTFFLIVIMPQVPFVNQVYARVNQV